MITNFLFCFVFIARFSTLFSDPLVQLPNGLIRGRADMTIHNKPYYVFEKIPYATPPVGNLRFKSPQPAQNWEGVLNTTYLDVLCYQNFPFFNQSEDCLFVNVHTPKLPNASDDDLLPVMFNIHGGAYMLGSSVGVKSDGIIDSDVILVTINYRLGVFGFLSTQDDVVPGNMGLKDQLLALKWTHDNIHLFGGDPERITILGQSAGSASVGYLLINQKSQGLYSGAILQSGTPLMPATFQRRPREVAFATAALLNDTFSSSNDSEALLDFLLTVDADDLRTATFNYQNSHTSPETQYLNQGLFFAPVLEVKNTDAFITEKMYSLLQAGNVVPVPIMIGMTSEESLGLETRDENFLKTYLAYYDQDLEWLAPVDIRASKVGNLTEIGISIREIYTEGEPFLHHLGDGVRFFSDSGFTRSTRKFAELYSKSSNTYFYQFSYDGDLGGLNVHYEGAESVGHGEDSKYIFCTLGSCDLSNYSESDQITAQRLIKLWTNFAKYRNPTPEPSELLQNITWPRVDENFFYLNINESLEIKDHPKQETYSKDPTPEPSELLQNITWPRVDENFVYLNINETLEIRDHPKQETYSKWVDIYNKH